MAEPFNDWAILELMGHRRLGGKVQDVEMFGGRMCRIDVPDAKDPAKMKASQFYAPGAIYALTPCTEEAARVVAKMSQPEPVQQWELPRALPPASDRDLNDDRDIPDEDGGL